MSADEWTNLDKIDQKIIEILNKNARTPSKEIASELRKTGSDVSDRTIRKRIERLEKSGIIKGYKAVLSDVSEISEYEAVFMKYYKFYYNNNNDMCNKFTFLISNLLIL